MKLLFLSRNFKKLIPAFNQVYFGATPLLLAACGGGNSADRRESMEIGFSSNYIPPSSNFEDPGNVDPSFKILEPVLTDPYWTKALLTDDGEMVVSQMLLEDNRTIKYSFPIEPPDYLPVTITGWMPSSETMISASREIFIQLQEILDVSAKESETDEGLNNFVIAQSIQPNTAGYSYFPNNHFQLGSDVFIAKTHSSPSVLQNGLTNYDYEVLLHEIGHALGLKHPFEADRTNSEVLTSNEDQTKFTAMSYNNDTSTFDGTFRPLDWMALSKLYGVNPNFQSDDDIYTFNDTIGKFIIDGNGLDTIDNSGSDQNTYIDLRPGTHSYEGQKSSFITDPKQLTISHGSEIENILTGSGNDILIGNHLPNIIKSGFGDDTIFGGEGPDIIYSGSGKDIIDLSEIVNDKDTVVIEKSNEGDYFDTVYGFNQRVSGDVFDITDLNFPDLTVLPIVDVFKVPLGYIDYCLVKVFGTDFNNINSIAEAFGNSGALENLKLSSGSSALLMTARSQDTGVIQDLYHIEKGSDAIEVCHLTQIIGNYLDIDIWSVENFVV